MDISPQRRGARLHATAKIHNISRIIMRLLRNRLSWSHWTCPGSSSAQPPDPNHDPGPSSEATSTPIESARCWTSPNAPSFLSSFGFSKAEKSGLEGKKYYLGQTLAGRLDMGPQIRPRRRLARPLFDTVILFMQIISWSRSKNGSTIWPCPARSRRRLLGDPYRRVETEGCWRVTNHST